MKETLEVNAKCMQTGGGGGGCVGTVAGLHYLTLGCLVGRIQLNHLLEIVLRSVKLLHAKQGFSSSEEGLLIGRVQLQSLEQEIGLWMTERIILTRKKRKNKKPKRPKQDKVCHSVTASIRTRYLLTAFQGLAQLLHLQKTHGQVEVRSQSQSFRLLLVLLRQARLVFQPRHDALVLHRGLLVLPVLKAHGKHWR